MFLSPAFDLRKRGRLACRGQLRSGLMSEACCAPCGLLDDLAHGRPRGLWPTYVNQPNGLRCLVQICKADFSADAGGTARRGSRNTSACTKQKKCFFAYTQTAELWTYLRSLSAVFSRCFGGYCRISCVFAFPLGSQQIVAFSSTGCFALSIYRQVRVSPAFQHRFSFSRIFSLSIASPPSGKCGPSAPGIAI